MDPITLTFITHCEFFISNELKNIWGNIWHAELNKNAQFYFFATSAIIGTVYQLFLLLLEPAIQRPWFILASKFYYFRMSINYSEFCIVYFVLLLLQWSVFCHFIFTVLQCTVFYTVKFSDEIVINFLNKYVLLVKSFYKSMNTIVSLFLLFLYITQNVHSWSIRSNA